MLRALLERRSRDSGDVLRRCGVLGAAGRSRLAAVALWLLVASGAMALPLSLSAAARPVVAGAPPAAEPVAPGPAGFAELFVAAYLQAGAGKEETLAAFLARPVQLPQTPTGRWYAARTAVLDEVAVGPGYWAVTVGVDVARVVPAGYEPVGLRCYRVSVQATAAGGPAYVATALPALVAAPARLAGSALASAAQPLDPGSPPADAVSRFLAAYLAGQGELSRYTAPGVVLTAVDPVPFRAVVVEQVTPTQRLEGARALALDGVPRDGDQVEVVAQADGRDAAGAMQVLTYGLQLRARAGRWEVAGLDDALPLALAAIGSELPP